MHNYHVIQSGFARLSPLSLVPVSDCQREVRESVLEFHVTLLDPNEAEKMRLG